MYYKRVEFNLSLSHIYHRLKKRDVKTGEKKLFEQQESYENEQNRMKNIRSLEVAKKLNRKSDLLRAC